MLRVELPCPELLESTLHFLYTGALPPCMGDGMGLDEMSGLLLNAKYLACESLITACTDIMYDYVTAGTHESLLQHSTLCPELVPSDFIYDVLADEDLPGTRRLEVALAWAGHGDGVSEAQVADLIPLLENQSEASDDATMAELCTRFPRGMAAFGPVLVANLAKRLTSLSGYMQKAKTILGTRVGCTLCKEVRRVLLE
jgi:hypothetical protein